MISIEGGQGFECWVFSLTTSIFSSSFSFFSFSFFLALAVMERTAVDTCHPEGEREQRHFHNERQYHRHSDLLQTWLKTYKTSQP